MKYTTISVSPETKEILKKLAVKGQTYDDILRELIKIATIKKLGERWNEILENDEFISFEELIELMKREKDIISFHKNKLK
ncbi:MAG: hypothetical protein FE045_01645 [Thermoplasmata archaeon]|nr:MAG: hypothetical protein FE045_01645 [Thermoplasmata archaeon]